jgi:LuxR family maltose regulon positive regulatory protein
MARSHVDAAGGVAARRPLVWSKLQAPVPRRCVSRPALLDLCTGARRKLTLIRAPAGWGKSTLVADWHASDEETRPFAWLALDRDDNDPVRFWTYLIEALRTQHPAAGARSLAPLQAPRVDVITDVLPVLSAEVATLPGRIVLVLDDYHLVTNPEIDDSLAFFVEHLPQALELVLASRSEPPLPLARLRARGELVEIDAQQLSFSNQEADLLLNTLHGLGLDHEAVTRLRDRTEGWVAGLYLAALTLRGRADADSFIQAFAGDDRLVVDYLSAEVLAGQPQEIRTFLLRTSILDRFRAPLCDAVTGRLDSRRLLRELESSNFFLVPLDTKRDWYRYHHLFGELLREELRLVEPEHIHALHRRACDWHRDFGSPSEAIRHATAAGDIADASELILGHWLEARDRARLATLLAWLDGLPPAAVTGDPRLCLVRASTLQEVGRVDEANDWLDAAERGEALDSLLAGPDSVATGIAACRAINQYFLGDASGIRDTVTPVIDRQVDGSGYWRSALLTTLGTALFAAGRDEDAALALDRAVSAAEESKHALALIHALGWSAAVHAENGESGRSEQVVRRIEALLGEQTGLVAYYGAAMACIARGMHHERRGRLPLAEEEVSRGTDLARRGDAMFEQVYGLTAHARLKGRLGDRRGATHLLIQAREALGACVDPGSLPERVARAEADLRVTGRRAAPTPYPEDLSDRERAVLRLLQTDLNQREIGNQLYVSFNTVKTHIKSIFRKLGVSTRHDAVRRARDVGLL